MKNKKIIAIALCIGIVTSSLSGITISFAQNSETNNRTHSNETANFQKKAESQNITALDAEVADKEIEPSTFSTNKETVIYDGTKTESSELASPTLDLYIIDADDIESFMEKGYTIEDIYEADKYGNAYGIDPKVLLDRKSSTNKDFKEVKDDILKEQREANYKKLKSKYKKEYKKLIDKGFKEEETMQLIEYINLNDKQLTEELIKNYKNKGTNEFKKDKMSSVSKEMKDKYGLTEKEAQELSEEVLKALEKASIRSNVPVKDLIKSYLKNKKKGD